jgi:xanthine dehydrogenase accessory factor
MRSELLILAAELVRNEEPFVLATVVRRQAASSARQGDGALITAAGVFHGWLGGSCTQPTVVREALRAISDGAPRLIALSPEPAKDRRPGVLAFPMTCHSGGTVDIYLEPVLPPSRFLVLGVSPVARALVRVAAAMGFVVDVADPGAQRAMFPEADRIWTDEMPARGASRPFTVVATMGERDEVPSLRPAARRGVRDRAAAWPARRGRRRRGRGRVAWRYTGDGTVATRPDVGDRRGPGDPRRPLAR